MNSPIIILSLRSQDTAGSNTGRFGVALNNGSVVALNNGSVVALNNGSAVLVYRLSVVLVCELSAVLVCGVINDSGSWKNIDRRMVRDIW